MDQDSSAPSKLPLGLLALALAMALRMFSRLTPIDAAAALLARTRTAVFSAPLMVTWLTP